jgi:5'-methylthioadenosine phosphorylase
VVRCSFCVRPNSKRETTFFGNGVVGHAGFGDPVCGVLKGYLAESCDECGITVHKSGTYVNMEGPQFSTRAESELHRSWGASVIGMTAAAEAKLCREAEISYAVLAMATDYDCWKTDEEDVSVAAVVATLTENVANATKVVANVIPRIIAHAGDHPMKGFMSSSVMTAPDAMPADTKAALAPIIGQYYK